MGKSYEASDGYNAKSSPQNKHCEIGCSESELDSSSDITAEAEAIRSSPMMYRPDIDGLRAIAIAAIILFHLGVGFKGGYIGVDIFFVISGYLITNIVLIDVQHGTFSFTRFWTKRIGRIMPAATAMVCVACAVGYLCLTPAEMLALGKSIASHSLGVANFYFLRDVGYFTEYAAYKPLLHLWSLSVEMQFYLLYPIVLIFIHKKFPDRMFQILAILASVSLLSYLIVMSYRESECFFLTPLRAWQFLAGGLIAISNFSGGSNRFTSEIAGIVGLAILCMTIMVYDFLLPISNFVALIPVAGTCLIIKANTQRTLVFRFLSNSLLVFFGKISYSLYLWHWPILVFPLFFISEPSLQLRILLIALAVITAPVFYFIFEEPMRRFCSSVGAKVTFWIAGVTTSLLTSVGVILVLTGGLPNRLHEPLRTIAMDMEYTGIEFNTITEGYQIGKRSQPDKKVHSPDFIVWGDSHASCITSTLDEKASAYGLTGIVYAWAGRIPITGLWPATRNDSKRAILETSEVILQKIINSKVRHLLLVSRWAVWADGKNDEELSANPGIKQLDYVLHSKDHREPSFQNSRQAIHDELEKMLLRLEDAGITVWILKQVPESYDSKVARRFFLAKRFPAWNDLPKSKVSFKDHALRQSNANAILDSFDSTLFRTIDPTQSFFDDQGNLLLFDERVFYRDDNHLTERGAEQLKAPLDTMFSNFAKEAVSR